MANMNSWRQWASSVVAFVIWCRSSASQSSTKGRSPKHSMLAKVPATACTLLCADTSLMR